MNLTTRAIAIPVAAVLACGAAVVVAAPANADTTGLSVSTNAATLTLPSTDNFRDSATVTVSSDTQETVSLTINDADGVVKTINDSLDLAADGDAFDATAAIDDTDLTAGDYTIVATDTTDDTITSSTPLTIGSGVATAVTLATTNGTTFYPLADGYKDDVKGTVSAVDETGLAIPFTATVAAGTANSSVSSTDGSAASFDLSLAGQATGSEDLTATVGQVSATPISLDLLPTTLTSATLVSQYSTFYPYHDNYRDTDNLTVNVVSSAPDTVPVTGSVKITRSGKTVATLPVTQTGETDLNWDGRVKGKTVAGTYTAKLSVSQDGVTKTSSKTIKVSSKKLVEKTTTSSKAASSILKNYVDYDSDGDSICLKHASLVGCFGYDSENDPEGEFSLIAHGAVSVPSSVHATFGYGHTPAVHVTAKVSSTLGDVVWAYGSQDDTNAVSGALSKGSHSLGWQSLTSTSNKVEIVAGLGEYSDFIMSKFTIEYRYWTLK